MPTDLPLEVQVSASRQVSLSTEPARGMVSNLDSADSVSIDGRRVPDQPDVDELQALMRAKGDALRATIHELRRPMGIVRGYVSLVRDETFGHLPEQSKDAMGAIEHGLMEMEALLGALAMTAKAEDMAGVVRRQAWPVGDLVAEAISLVSADASANSLTIDAQLPNPDVIVSVDRGQLRTAVLNLLVNAVKFSSAGSAIKVTVTGDMHEARIAVADRGPGIDADDWERIFEPWQRMDESDESGLGLGLYLVRRLVELHDGRVSLESTPGRGSTFTVRLPR